MPHDLNSIHLAPHTTNKTLKYTNNRGSGTLGTGMGTGTTTATATAPAVRVCLALVGCWKGWGGRWREFYLFIYFIIFIIFMCMNSVYCDTTLIETASGSPVAFASLSLTHNHTISKLM